MKLMRAHGSIVIVPRRNSRAAWAGLLDPHGDHTCGWTTSHCTVTVPGDTGSVGDAVHHRQQASSRIWRVATSLPVFYRPRSRSSAPVPSRYTRSVVKHPLRRDAPDQKGCNAYGSGAPPHRQQACARLPRWRRPRRHPTGPGRTALYPLGSIAPVREHYTTSGLV